MNQVHPHMRAWERGHSFNRYGSCIVQLFMKSLLMSLSGIQTLCVRVVERLKQLEVHESTIGVRPTVAKQVHPRT